MFDLKQIRREFPILKEGTYLDSAATAQKPKIVIDALKNFYETENANVHRGMHTLSEKATAAFEGARTSVQKFINAKSSEEIVFTSGTTESINLVAKTWGKENVGEDDAIVLTLLEHHSNITPWIQLKDENDCAIEWVELDKDENINLTQLSEHLIKGNVKLVAVTGQSNVTGVRTPLKGIIKKAHEAGALVLVDAAQLIAHHPIDVQDLDCDFLALSGHKLYGPTGVGVLYGKRELLESMPPFLTGGGMIAEVKRDHFTCAGLPTKFEAGTPPIAQAVGLRIAIDWLSQFNWSDIEAHEQSLIEKAFQELNKIEGLTILGPSDPKNISGCISFSVDGIHPHDLTDIVGQKGVFMRAGHHCAQPLHEHYGIPASTRLSVGIYNNEDDIAKVAPAIEEAKKIFS
ncbi:SufS family cysteine desulfurase [Patescibacteria group bacterium]|nr:SufS family cysteine desulfurase [Patescibacteria group bacterium]